MAVSLKRFAQYSLVAASIVLCVMYLPQVLAAVGLLFGAASALLLGCAIAYIWNILLVRFERMYFPHTVKSGIQKSRRPVCILLSFGSLALILALVFQIVLPELTASLMLVGQEIPGVVEKIRAWLVGHAGDWPALQAWLNAQDIDWPTLLRNAMNLLIAGAGGIFNSAVSVAASVTGAVVRGVIAFIFSLYLLFDKERLSRQLLRTMDALLKPKCKKQILYVLNTANECFSHFIVGQCMEAVILGVLCGFGMTVLRLPYAMMTGTIIGVTALIPVAGAYIGGAVGAFMILTVDPWKAMIFLLFLVALQQMEGNLIYPRVVGGSIGLPGIWVLATVTIGGGLLGILGMLLGVPIAATLYQLLGNFVREQTPDYGAQEAPTPPASPQSGKPSAGP